MNNMFQCYNKRKELPIDLLLIQLLNFEASILYEYNRAIRKVGEFKLKRASSKTSIPLQIICEILLLHQELYRSWKRAHAYLQKKGRSQKTLAESCEIEWNDRRNVYNVKGPLSTKFELVQFQRNKFVCTCPQRRECFHILAVRERRRYELISSRPTAYRLSSILHHEKESKDGRKAPRKRDTIRSFTFSQSPIHELSNENEEEIKISDSRNKLASSASKNEELTISTNVKVHHDPKHSINQEY